MLVYSSSPNFMASHIVNLHFAAVLENFVIAFCSKILGVLCMKIAVAADHHLVSSCMVLDTLSVRESHL